MAGLGQSHQASVLDSQLRIRHIDRVKRAPMNKKPSKSKAVAKELTPVQRGQAAAKLMAKELRAEHKRWNLPLLSWKNGKVVATKP